MKTSHITLTLALVALPVISGAQDIDAVLSAIERNNVELQSLRQEAEAARYETRIQNNLGDPTIEYSPFWAKGTDGISSSELVVSYGFDFPTQYASRSKAGKMQREVIDRQYLVARRDLMLRAKTMCLDLVCLHRKQELLSNRLENADGLLALFRTRYEAGDASAIELNKIRMEKMDIAAQMAQVETELESVRLSLQAMNGDNPVELSMYEYPVVIPLPDFRAFRDSLLAGELEIMASEAAVEAAEQEVRVNSQNWLPQLQVGYRRNTALREASNGFIVGASFPLFSNRHKSRIAKARHTASCLQLEETRIQAESRIRSQYDGMLRLKEMMDAYDVELMEETLGMLRKAVEAGQLSIIEYYTEADAVYANLLALSETENTYHKLMAEIYRNSL